MKIRRTQDQITRDTALCTVIRAMDTVENVIDAANESLGGIGLIAPECTAALTSAQEELDFMYNNIQSWTVKGDRRRA